MSSIDRLYMISLPQGKPDTAIPLCKETKDLRAYVRQPPQKGHTCTFYALAMLRNRIGKNPGPEYLEARKIEELYSRFRKRQTQLFSDLQLEIPAFVSDLSKKGWNIDSKQGIREFLPVLKTTSSSELKKKTTEIFQQFLQQEDYGHFSSFLERLYWSSQRAVYDWFLKQMNVDPKKEFNKWMLYHGLESLLELENSSAFSDRLRQLDELLPRYDNLNEKQVDAVMSEYSFIAAAKALGFRTSEWEPSQPIEQLHRCLQSEGPLVLGGFFGRTFYRKPASLVEMIEKRPIYGWGIADRLVFDSRYSTELSGHAIVVIGVAYGGQKRDFVFYVDPADGSDPQNPLQQKTYVISYENLKMNVRGFHELVSLKPKRLLGYAQYFPKENKI